MSCFDFNTDQTYLVYFDTSMSNNAAHNSIQFSEEKLPNCEIKIHQQQQTDQFFSKFDTYPNQIDQMKGTII